MSTPKNIGVGSTVIFYDNLEFEGGQPGVITRYNYNTHRITIALIDALGGRLLPPHSYRDDVPFHEDPQLQKPAVVRNFGCWDLCENHWKRERGELNKERELVQRAEMDRKQSEKEEAAREKVIAIWEQDKEQDFGNIAKKAFVKTEDVKRIIRQHEERLALLS